LVDFFKSTPETTWPKKAKFTEGIYGRSSIRFLHFIQIGQKTWSPHFIQIGQKTWSPWVFLVSDWLKFKKIFSSETRWHNKLLLCRNDVRQILCKMFCAVRTTNMAAIGSSCLWLTN
jgi:hypothetical protein